MNKEAQQIAIAKACDWKDVKYTYHEEVDIENRSIIHWSGLTGIPPEFTHYENRVRIPGYLHDLNAMHEAEEELGSYIPNFLKYLNILKEVNPMCVRATAAQRAEAFLRTIEKWEDK
jgi:hypothetical protein